MNRGLLPLLAAGVFVTGSAQLFAQDMPNQAGPPKVLRIYREEMKPGKEAAHEKIESGYVHAFKKANWPIHYIAMSALAGPSEVWFCEGHDSFASIGKEEETVEKTPALKAELEMLDQQDGALRTGGRGIIAVFQPEMSYRAGDVGDEMLAKDRYMSLLRLRVKPGQETAFREASKLIHDGDEKANMEHPVVVYQVVSGMPGGTYFIFFPMKSMDYYDTMAERSKALRDAMGDNWDRFQTLSSQCIMDSEYSLFALSPKMSYVSKEFASADPEFWNPKPSMPVRAKGPAKTTAKAGE